MLEDHLKSGDLLDLSNRVDRTIPGCLLREILIDKRLARDPRGLTVRGARIPDDLDLSYCTLPAPLRLRGVDFKGVLMLQGATIRGDLELTEAVLNGANNDGNALVGDGLTVDGGAFLGKLKVTKGAICLSRAAVTGVLRLTDAELYGNDGNGDALVLDGLRVNGGAFLGKLIATKGAIRLSRATIKGALVLTEAKLFGKNDEGTALVGDGLTVDGGAFLEQLTVTEGAIRLTRAKVTGALKLTEAKLFGKNDKGTALVGDGLTVDGDASLGNLEVTGGAVRLAGATISGQLELTGAQLNGKDINGAALVADGLTVEGGAFLVKLIATKGAIRLSRATIKGALVLTESKLFGKNDKGTALVGDGLTVDGDASLGNLEVTGGAVRLAGATISGQLELTGAQLNGKDINGDAFAADGLCVHGDALLREIKVARVPSRLLGATVTGQLKLRAAELNGKNDHGNALAADRLRVDGSIFLEKMTVRSDATLALRYGRLGNLVLDDNPPSGGWPRYSFVGLQYDQIHGGPATSARQGARLLASQADKPRPAQSYWQLADYYAKVGNEPAARRLRVWSNVVQAGAHPWSWPRCFLYGLTTGFGYYPFLALLWLTLLIGVDTGAVNAHRSDFIPSKAPAISVSVAKGQPPVNSSHCDTRYPCFNPVLYATDTVIPVISLGQQDAWRVDTSRAGPDLELLATKALGWILTTLLVGGVGGLLRRS